MNIWNEIWKRGSIYLRINDNRATLREKAKGLYSHKRNEDELEVYNEIITLDPDDEEAWHYKGDALFLLNRYEEAIKAYEGAIRLGPKDADLPKLEDVSFDDDEKYDADLYREYVAHPWHGKANALYNLRRHKEALAAWDEAMKRELYEREGKERDINKLIEEFKDSLRRREDPF